MTPYCVIDLETGGLSSDTCGITELAAVAAEHDRAGACHITDRICLLVRPQPDLEYLPGALEIQHRTLADLAVGMCEEAALLALYGWVRGVYGPAGRPQTWAHNADFDGRFLMAAHARYDSLMERAEAQQPVLHADHGQPIEDLRPVWRVACPIPIPMQCSMRAFKWLGKQGLHTCSSANLDTVLAHYGITVRPECRHTALGDAEATAQAIACMLRDYPEARRAERLVAPCQ
jgi:DNA polymerase III epsilon subunit-like protein